MFKNNRNLLIIALIAVVNALGYGIIIPVLYSYSRRFGLSDFQNGLLFAIFSACQFISTPIIGRMSDRFGRRPLLLISLAGTAVSFFIMAKAPSAAFLFFARALDGLTAGNLPVAQAVISDTTSLQDRPRGFGVMGAAFGFGFIFGPAISALTVGINTALPFLIAGTVSLIAVVITAIFLPETNKHMGEVKQAKLFDFGKLYHALFAPNVGATLLITLFYFSALSSFIYAFQPYSVKILNLAANQISLLFTVFGVFGLIMQMFFVQRIAKRFGLKHSFSGGLLIVSFSLLITFFSGTLLLMFVASLILFALAGSLVQPLTNTILSRETDEKSQGTILGLNASYMSIGQILGPIVGGTVTTVAIPYPFLAASLMVVLCFFLSFKVLKRTVPKESAF